MKDFSIITRKIILEYTLSFKLLYSIRLVIYITEVENMYVYEVSTYPGKDCQWMTHIWKVSCCESLTFVIMVIRSDAADFECGKGVYWSFQCEEQKCINFFIS